MSNPLQLQIEREIVNMLESSIEDTRVPDAIATYADKRAGKPVTLAQRIRQVIPEESSEKLTKQGVRDLGGNNVRRREPVQYKTRQFEVDCSTDGGWSGLVLHIEARSLDDAIRQANAALKQANTSLVVSAVREHGQTIWWR